MWYVQKRVSAAMPYRGDIVAKQPGAGRLLYMTVQGAIQGEQGPVNLRGSGRDTLQCGAGPTLTSTSILPTTRVCCTQTAPMNLRALRGEGAHHARHMRPDTPQQTLTWQ